MKSLRIGFASIYAWRPHNEHMVYMAGLLQQAGHDVSFLACDADLGACYTRELRDVRPDWLECAFCRAGGVRSYPVGKVHAIGDLAPHGDVLSDETSRHWAASSAATLGRFETPNDYESAEFLALRDRLAPGVATAHAAATAWIRRERLDAVFVFNGRMDATRAIFEASRAAGLRTITFERTLFSDGIQLLPEENSLGLKTIHRVVGEWSRKPLTRDQAHIAAAHVASRLAGTNVKEWRAFNTDARSSEWPVRGKRRILMLPGSLNECWGDANWASGWPDTTDAFDAVIARLGLQADELALRCHPNWAERIGKSDGRRAERHYSEWAMARGIHLIPSADRTSTMSLIAQCDAVLLGSGSAAVEAAALGKQVVGTAPSSYQEAGFRTDATDPRRLAALSLNVDLPAPELARAQETLRRGVLRYLYAMSHRLAQYVPYVRAVSTTCYRYVPGAPADRLVDLVRTGLLVADDNTHAADTSGEDEVVAAMARGDWAGLDSAPVPSEGARGPRRRWFLQPIDLVRDKMAVGDR